MKKYLLTTLILALPVIVGAEERLGNVRTIVESISGIIGLLIPIVFALALLYFFWGLAKYILASGEGKEEGKTIMIWGVVALFVMASVWGIVKFIQDAFGIQGENVNVPTVPGLKK